MTTVANKSGEITLMITLVNFIATKTSHDAIIAARKSYEEMIKGMSMITTGEQLIGDSSDKVINLYEASITVLCAPLGLGPDMVETLVSIDVAGLDSLLGAEHFEAPSS